MSKSKGNLVAPEEIIDTDGADALRLAHLPVKPPEEDVDWEDVGLEGCSRFLPPGVAPGRARRATCRAGRAGGDRGRSRSTAAAHRLIQRHHRRLRAVVLQHRRRPVHGVRQRPVPYVQSAGPHAATFDAVDTLLQLLAPAAPAHHRRAVGAAPRRRARARAALAAWPTPSWSRSTPSPWSCRSTARSATGSRSTPAPTRPHAEALALASAEGAERSWTAPTPKKVIARPPKLVNIVV